MVENQQMSTAHAKILPICLTVAGSDSGGGAGIQTDLRMFNFAEVFGCSVITALTAQNPREVLGVEITQPAFVEKQLDAVFKLPIAAMKTGMLGNQGVIDVVSETLQRFSGPKIVDPVMISTSGCALLEPEAMQAYVTDILPYADIITPNLHEAQFLLGRRLKNFDEVVRGAYELAERFSCCAVIKGGHSPDKDYALDVVAERSMLSVLRSPRVACKSTTTHGTGCSFSALVCAFKAQKKSNLDALDMAKKYLFTALHNAKRIAPNLSQIYPFADDYFDPGLFNLCDTRKVRIDHDHNA